MAILLRNSKAEQAVRELAQLTGESLATAIEIAVKDRLAAKRATATKHKPRSVAVIDAITWKYLTPEARAGLIPPITKSDYDALNAIPGVDDE